MKRFEFHLDGLLRVKRQLEHVAELEHQKAERRVGECAARVEQLKALLARAADGMAAKVGQAMAAGEWAASFVRAERLGHQIAAAAADLRAAELQSDAARRDKARVSTEVEALSTLRGQQWDQWRQEAAAADQERLTELGLRRWAEQRVYTEAA